MSLFRQIGCLISIVAFLGAAAKPRLVVRPQVCFPPCSIEVRITPPDQGRMLIIEVASEEYYDSWEGPKPPYTMIFPFRRLPSGHYLVRAQVPAVWSATASLEVMDAAQ